MKNLICVLSFTIFASSVLAGQAEIQNDSDGGFSYKAQANWVFGYNKYARCNKSDTSENKDCAYDVKKCAYKVWLPTGVEFSSISLTGGDGNIQGVFGIPDEAVESRNPFRLKKSFQIAKEAGEGEHEGEFKFKYENGLLLSFKEEREFHTEGSIGPNIYYHYLEAEVSPDLRTIRSAKYQMYRQGIIFPQVLRQELKCVF